MTLRPLSLTLLLLSACQSRLTGNEGNFQFAYVTDDDIVDFNKPIAVGGKLDLTITAVEDGQAVTLTGATTDDTSVLNVASYTGYSVTVEGVGDGGALLSVDGTTASGNALHDSVNLLARTPEVLVLSHTCTGTGGTAGYLAGSTAWVPYELEMTNGQSVIGYGYYPVTAAGGVTLREADSDATWMVLDTGAAGTATLTSAIDDTVLTMQVVEEAALDGVQEPIPFVLEDIDVGDTNSFYVRPMVGDTVVCQANTEKTVVSDTPDICTVRDADAADPTLNEYGWFEIEGVAAGTCSYTVTFTFGAGGAGASAQFSYEIEP